MNAVDTNVLVYAVSADELVKGPVALQLLDGLSASNTIIPWQVLCEFGSVLTKLRRMGRAPDDIESIVSAIRGRFPLVMPSASVLERGLQLQRQHSLAYWDAMLIAACLDAGVGVLHSEDLPGCDVTGLKILNPFAG